MALWEQIALAGMALLILVWFGPGVSAAVKASRQGTRADWLGFLLPIALVAGFVVLLIALARA